MLTGKKGETDWRPWGGDKRESDMEGGEREETDIGLSGEERVRQETKKAMSVSVCTKRGKSGPHQDHSNT